MATATKQGRRVAALREAYEKDRTAYAAAVGMIAAVAGQPNVYDDPIDEIRQILAALDEVTGYDRD